MGDISDRFASTFRDYKTDGVPASGSNDPAKSDIRTIGSLLDQRIGGAVAGLKFYATQSGLFADKSQTNGTLAYVYNDATSASNGVYHADSTTTNGWVVDTAYAQAVAAVVQPLINQIPTNVAPRLTALETTVNGQTGGGGLYPAKALDLNINAGLTTLSSITFTQVTTIAGVVVSAPAGSATLYRLSASSTAVTAVYESIAVTLTGDPTTVYPWNVTFQPGDVIAIYMASSGPSIGAQTGSVVYYASGLPTAGATLQIVGGYRTAIGWTYAPSLEVQIQTLTAAVAMAQAAALPPITPVRFRSVLPRLIATKSPLVFITDSLGEGEFRPSSVNTSFINLIGSFANAGYSPATEPGCTIVVTQTSPVKATPAWFGLNVSGGAVFNSGPLGQSVKLAAGDYIEFTGNYGEAEAFYDQIAGSGQLQRTVNGANAVTIDASAGSAHDLMTAFGAASGTIRFTAVSGSVVVTGVHRVGTKPSSGASEPLRMQRNSFGGYSAASFMQSRLDAVIAQAKALGPTPEYTIALMTNDWAFGTGLADFTANVERVLSYIFTNGSPSRVNWISPTRPGPGGNVIPASATAAGFDQFVAAVAAGCAAHGARHLALSETEWAGVPNAFDGDQVHWLDKINAAVAQRFIQWRTA